MGVSIYPSSTFDIAAVIPFFHGSFQKLLSYFSVEIAAIAIATGKQAVYNKDTAIEQMFGLAYVLAATGYNLKGSSKENKGAMSGRKNTPKSGTRDVAGKGKG